MLVKLKDYLKITWDNEDESLNGLIERGKNYLNNIAGRSLDYDEHSIEEGLLLDYCRYGYNHSLQEQFFELLKKGMR